jgi:cell division transport system ATP-binding protein
MSSPIIEIHNLTWSYPWSSQLIFDNFSFELDQGDFCFLVGKSGSGKTTLVKFLLRQLVPPLKTIFYHKEDIARFSSDEVQNYRRNLGVVFQDYKLIETMTVWENITYPLIIDNIDPIEKYEFLEGILKIVWLSEKQHIPCQLLSGWEKQRVSIARSLASDPAFIIADEPTGNLDRDNSKQIADSMITLHKQGHTILFITHDQKLIEYIKDHHKGIKVATMDIGK